MPTIIEAPEALRRAVATLTATKDSVSKSTTEARDLEKRHCKTYDNAYDLLRVISRQSHVPHDFRTEPIPTKIGEKFYNLSLMSTEGGQVFPDSIAVIVESAGDGEVLFRIDSNATTRDFGRAVNSDGLDQVDGILKFISEQNGHSYPVDKSQVPPERERSMREIFIGDAESRRRVRIMERRLREGVA